MKGPYEFEFEGKTRGFLFNFMVLAILEERNGIQFDELFSHFKKGNKAPKIRLILQFFEAAAINYCDENSIPVDFKLSDIGDWIQVIGFEKAVSLMTGWLNPKTPKNSKPLLQTTEG